MSILGFDAIGRLALGQMRVSGSNVVAGGAGSYVIGGNGAIFGLRTTGVATNYALAGNAAAFIPTLSGSAGSYHESGDAALFSISAVSIGTNYSIVGNPVKTAMALSVAVGSYIIVYNRVAGTAALNAGIAAYQVTGSAAALSRDYVNWWPTQPIASNWTGEIAPSPEWTISISVSPAWTAGVPAVSA
ncbi:hypothetical protein JQ559_01045 [Bradyrhizobium viridifuturi]|jgi:hypothetical protein|nr:hypothetical protein [Bradyrhizobium viridifuturi]ERF85436.1 MAG: hypothetical protein C207_01173 [Bradyrhizobium sp. DFCI-1]MCA3792640.1 hypothetical protein [Burkholderia sp.]OYU64259.1 MAG: hypothetical protein CFE30_01255 [Bradyrhizobium sp. PARBB1]PSO25740.1 hypothetical protein C7G43_14755 [Bradyrhizobium sp. MOS004]QRI67813.1 hypothetical protein JQ507_22960 [Bradyrhizobium sp. PSBB068]HAR17434.1 hypothetical protein [Bradyrhizobium sp.]